MANTVASMFFGQTLTNRTVIGMFAACVNGEKKTAIRA